jgi:hypothetical protein
MKTLKLISQMFVTSAFIFMGASSSTFADGGSRQVQGSRLDQAQEVLAFNYVKNELTKLHHMEWSSSQHKLTLSDVLSCVVEEISCFDMIESYFLPSEFDQVSSACIEVLTIHGEGTQARDWSAETAKGLSYSKFLFPIFHGDQCKTDLSDDEYDEYQYRISVAFSGCTDVGCSVRTQIKRNGDWCGYGRRTTNSISIIDGFEFSVLDGLLVEKI